MLLKEILGRHVFYPLVDVVADPNFINVRILNWLQKNRMATEMRKKTFSYAKSYEEFMKIIEETNDVEDLKHIRYSILTEIMQATTMNNVRIAKGKDRV